MLGLGCFWGAERIFWQLPGVHTTAVGYGGGVTPNPTYEEVCSGRTGHNEVVLVVFRPAEISLDEILRNFWEGHDPTQGMRQGNDVGTQYRSGIYVTGESQKEAALASRDRYAEALPSAGPRRRDHHRDRRRGPLLLRRGLPPAVPRQEPERLLRPRRHGRLAARSGVGLQLEETRRREAGRSGGCKGGHVRPPLRFSSVQRRVDGHRRHQRVAAALALQHLGPEVALGERVVGRGRRR